MCQMKLACFDIGSALPSLNLEVKLLPILVW